MRRRGSSAGSRGSAPPRLGDGAADLLGVCPSNRAERSERAGESDAILFYLADGTRFLPAQRYARAQVLQWMFFEEKIERGYQALDVMERQLAGRQFFVEDRYTIADIALYAYTHVAHEGGFDLSPSYPNVRAWFARVTAEPDHVPIAQAVFG